MGFPSYLLVVSIDLGKDTLTALNHIMTVRQPVRFNTAESITIHKSNKYTCYSAMFEMQHIFLSSKVVQINIINGAVCAINIFSNKTKQDSP